MAPNKSGPQGSRRAELPASEARFLFHSTTRTESRDNGCFLSLCRFSSLLSEQVRRSVEEAPRSIIINGSSSTEGEEISFGDPLSFSPRARRGRILFVIIILAPVTGRNLSVPEFRGVAPKRSFHKKDPMILFSPFFSGTHTNGRGSSGRRSNPVGPQHKQRLALLGNFHFHFFSPTLSQKVWGDNVRMLASLPARQYASGESSNTSTSEAPSSYPFSRKNFPSRPLLFFVRPRAHTPTANAEDSFAVGRRECGEEQGGSPLLLHHSRTQVGEWLLQRGVPRFGRNESGGCRCHGLTTTTQRILSGSSLWQGRGIIS